MKETLSKIKDILGNIHPLPWEGSGNYPFYVDVKKPRHSLSKHDDERPSYWAYPDGEYLYMCVNEMPKILEHIEKLEAQVTYLSILVEGLNHDK